ncbi:MAG: hypothetical protein OEY56_08560, partial [Cyclobacteriaceae bacterium]|nr:hypothetical protein [Cyclobacteriaceae bacterium]
MEKIKPLIPHLIAVLIFFVISSVFFFPLYEGKALVQSDNVQLTGTHKEITDFQEKGEQIRWTNKEFSGMPILSGSTYNLFGFLNHLLYYGIAPKPVMMVLTLLLGFYVLSLVMGVSRWLAVLGSFAFAFSTFNIISIEAGHDNKVLAMAFMAPVLAGVILAYRGNYLKGSVLTAVAAGFQLLFGHIQITYYLLIMVIAYLIVVVVQTIKSGEWKRFVHASLCLAGATLVAVGCNFGKLTALYEYSSYSTRGGSELSSQQNEGGGLDKDYALAWSNGVMETFTVMFPYFHGGATGEKLSPQSATYKSLQSRGVDGQTIQQVTANAPLYWGTQPFTAGPIYFGVLLVMFYILGLFILDGPIRWWGLSLLLLSLFLAMGKNAEWFTNLFFYYVPMYNKFRSVTMIMSMAQLIVPLGAILALDRLFSEGMTVRVKQKHVLVSLAIVVGTGLFFLLFKSAFFDFTGPNDGRYGFPDWLLDALAADRVSRFSSDIWRSLIISALGTAVVWLFIQKKIKTTYLIAGISLLVFIDLWAVNKRYLGADDFQAKSRVARQSFQPSPADTQILQDKSYYRVLDLTKNPFADGLTSYFHFSIGGYSAIKMQRYQEVIDRYLSQANEKVLSMLNTRYFITPGENNRPV